MTELSKRDEGGRRREKGREEEREQEERMTPTDHSAQIDDKCILFAMHWYWHLLNGKY